MKEWIVKKDLGLIESSLRFRRAYDPDLGSVDDYISHSPEPDEVDPRVVTLHGYEAPSVRAFPATGHIPRKSLCTEVQFIA